MVGGGGEATWGHNRAERSCVDQFVGLGKEGQGDVVETITDVSRCKAGEGASIGSFENDAESISGEHLVPGSAGGREKPARCRGGLGIAIDEFVPRR